MKRIFERLELVEYLTLTLDIRKDEFVKILKQNVEAAGIGGFSDVGDRYFDTDKIYKGSVSDDVFRIKKINTWINADSVLLTGKCLDSSSSVRIEIELNGIALNYRVGLITLSVIAFFSVIFILENEMGSLFLVAVLGVLMVTTTLLSARRAVRNVKKEVEHDFFYMIHSKDKRVNNN